MFNFPEHKSSGTFLHKRHIASSPLGFCLVSHLQLFAFLQMYVNYFAVYIFPGWSFESLCCLLYPLICLIIMIFTHFLSFGQQKFIFLPSFDGSFLKHRIAISPLSLMYLLLQNSIKTLTWLGIGSFYWNKQLLCLFRQ